MRQAGLSFRVNDHNLKQAMLLASMSQAYQNLAKEQEDKNFEYQTLAEAKINESLKYLNKQGNNTTSPQGLQIKVLVKANEGELLANKSKQQAIKAYTAAYKTLKNHPNKTNPFQKNQILTTEDIESVHRGLLNLQSNRNQEVRNSLKEHFYATLENSLKLKDWRTADLTTDTLMLFIADREEERFINIPQIEKFSCSELKKMDDLWVQNSQGHFGFSVQKRIWVETGNRLGVKLSDWNKNDEKNYLRFATRVGWYNDRKKNERESNWVRYADYIDMVMENNDPFDPLRLREGGLPGMIGSEIPPAASFLALRLVNCNI